MLRCIRMTALALSLVGLWTPLPSYPVQSLTIVSQRPGSTQVSFPKVLSAAFNTNGEVVMRRGRA
jgi:hypothetical protein